jgi:outer membrane protein OmpA-like peptidoglycan-associated protein
MRRTRLIALFALFPALFAGTCNKDKVTPEPDGVDATDTEAANPEVELQVISLEPDEVEPGSAFQGTVFGTGFGAGASVNLGATRIAAVTVNDENTLTVSVPPMGTGVYDLKVTNADGTSATLRDGLVVQAAMAELGMDCGAIRVGFGFDSANLLADAQEVLADFLPCFQRGVGTVRVEGHSDERGTTGYNLALGQRRADSIERYLATQGVSPGRIRTISYGEELPADRGHDEQAWEVNRRGDVSVEDK